jgi:hypothetical protein
MVSIVHYLKTALGEKTIGLILVARGFASGGGMWLVFGSFVWRLGSLRFTGRTRFVPTVYDLDYLGE